MGNSDNKLIERLATFFIVFPALIALTFWDVYYHLPLSLVVISASILGAFEMAALLRSKDMQTNIYLPILFGMAFPLMAYLELCGFLKPHHTIAILSLLIMLVFIRQIFVNTEQGFQPVLGKVAGNLLTLIYPGFFLYYMIKILSFEHPSVLLAIFALAVFGNDAAAWLFGNLFGKNSPKPFLVSPKKSIIGFIGGIIASYTVLIITFYVSPHLLGRNLWVVLILALVISLTTIIGDLFESALKRSAGIKDSGTIIPGRGGILDSIDSLLFSAPVFYIFLMYGRF